jgi:HTH-type transcriptional regulator / antitoxin HigA
MLNNNEYFPETFTHPGFTLNEKLKEIGMSKKEFALRTEKPEQTIIKIINGNSSITPDMSIQFENVLKIPANFWLKKQYKYDEIVARNKRRAAIDEAKEWAGCFPYAAMANLGWVPITRKIEEKIDALFNFFGISGKTAWENYYFKQKLKVNFRISLKQSSESYAISAWLRRGEILATELNVPAYNGNLFKKNLKQIKTLMVQSSSGFFEKLQNLCKQAGVKVVYTPCLPKAPIHGSTRWVGNVPLIQLSARYRKNDIFWFTFFHEVGHILLHGKKYVSVENIDIRHIDLKKENEANAFAIDCTFSEKQEKELLEASPLNEDDILFFAEKFNTHPAIMIGRLHHKKIIHYSVGRKFIEPINLSN